MHRKLNMYRFRTAYGAALKLGLGIVLFANLSSASAQDSKKVTDEEIIAILQKNCSACHLDSDDGGIDYITDLAKMVKKRKIVPGNLDKSRIWVRINDAEDPMPPEDEDPRPTESEIAKLKQYILNLKKEAGSDPAPPPQQKVKETRETKITDEMVIQAIHSYLADVDEEDRRYKRFFSLHHLYNLPTADQDRKIGVSNSYLNLVRAGVSKSMNSLTWAPSVATPKMLGPDNTVMVIDTRDYEWDRSRAIGRPELWEILIREYPYGLRHDLYPDDRRTQSRVKEIYRWTGIDIPWIRADWFVANATQTHNYHILLYDAVQPSLRRRAPKLVEYADGKKRLEQPMNASDLYGWLKVDVNQNLRRGRAARAGFMKSGVSSQNRLIERHPAAYGYIWPSYDFKKGAKRMNLNALPLGPDGVFNRKLEQFSFEHDGGEMIFGLPNGLHGFYLCDGKGDRIPFGPPDVVFDKTRTLGNGVIVNGVSCIACHKNGLIEEFDDEIRKGATGFPSEARRMVRDLFLERDDLDVLIKKDQTRYRAAALETIKPFITEQQATSIQEGGNLIEPIDPVTTRFLVKTINLSVMAAELGIDPEELKGAIKFNEELKRLGLMVVAQGGTINRELWESGDGLTIYQKAAQILKLGTPTSVQPAPWRGR